MGNNTTNLNLYKTNMQTDGNDLFDFDRDLNQNFDKIDTAVGKLEDLTTTAKGDLVCAINEVNDKNLLTLVPNTINSADSKEVMSYSGFSYTSLIPPMTSASKPRGVVSWTNSWEVGEPCMVFGNISGQTRAISSSGTRTLKYDLAQPVVIEPEINNGSYLEFELVVSSGSAGLPSSGKNWSSAKFEAVMEDRSVKAIYTCSAEDLATPTSGYRRKFTGNLPIGTIKAFLFTGASRVLPISGVSRGGLIVGIFAYKADTGGGEYVRTIPAKSTSTSGKSHDNPAMSLKIVPNNATNAIIYDYTNDAQLQQVPAVIEGAYLPDVDGVSEGACFFCNDPTNNFGKQKQDGAWVDKEFCKVGQVSTSSGAITGISTYSFNTNGYEFHDGGAGMPSDRYIDLELKVSGSTYIAPSNGWYAIGKKTGVSDRYMALRNECSSISTQNSSTNAVFQNELYLPAKKGDIVRVLYDLTGITIYFRFIYAEGASK